MKLNCQSPGVFFCLILATSSSNGSLPSAYAFSPNPTTRQGNSRNFEPSLSHISSLAQKSALRIRSSPSSFVSTNHATSTHTWRRIRPNSNSILLRLSNNEDDNTGTSGNNQNNSESEAPSGDEMIESLIEQEIAVVTQVDDDRSLNLDPALSDEQTQNRQKDQVVRNVLRRLADLSLKDYEWRSSVFKSNEADRQVEESLARMMGEEAAYVRPMDAAEEKRGPLGQAEKKLVTWLSSVIEEEGQRARRIASSDGDLVRPIDLDVEVGGPLSKLERSVVNFIDSIRTSETERATNKILRPKDLEESKRGPLGNAEAKAVSKLSEIASAEKMRAQLSMQRGGEVVRPIDVPGPLGEVEKKVLEAMSAERQRAKEREMNDGKCVRPKDATVPGPLGEAERKATQDLELLRMEEQERLKNIRRFLEEKRPMSTDRDSPLGLTEAFTVGLLKGPRLLGKVAERVLELMSSSKLDDKDVKIMKGRQTNSQVSEDGSEQSPGLPMTQQSSYQALALVSLAAAVAFTDNGIPFAVPVAEALLLCAVGVVIAGNLSALDDEGRQQEEVGKQGTDRDVKSRRKDTDGSDELTP